MWELAEKVRLLEASHDQPTPTVNPPLSAPIKYRILPDLEVQVNRLPAVIRFM